MQGQKGFTLLEMSIVITIIAMLIGGILIGKTMVRTAQLKSVVTEMQQYTQAIAAFRDQYMALPGDFTGATALWGAAAGCANGTGTQTCNGNGNGLISHDVATFYTEQFYAWQHLSNAKLIEGHFSGVVGSSQQRVPGQNVPESSVGGAWGLTDGTVPLAGSRIPYNTGDIYPRTMLWLGGGFAATAAQRGVQSPLFFPEEAWQIDQKVDDGYPHYGKLVAQINLGSMGGNCYSGTSYRASDKEKLCAFGFKTGF